MQFARIATATTAAASILTGSWYMAALHKNQHKKSLDASYAAYDVNVKSGVSDEIKNAECYKSEDNIHCVAEVFTESFMNDPAFSYVVTDLKKRKLFLRDFFTLQLKLLPGRVYEINNFSGTMLWTRGSTETIDSMMLVLNGGIFNLLRLRWDRLLVQLQFFDTLEKKRKLHVGGVEDYYVLLDIGVRPNCQGHGYSSTLLKYFLRYHADSEGVPCYLEASSESSRRLYERHGFVVVETVRIPPDGPPIWLMVKKAQRSG